MTKEELNKYVVRGKGVIVRSVTKETTSGILLSDGREKSEVTTNFYIYKVGEEITDLKEGDEVSLAAGALMEIFVSDKDKGEDFDFTTDSFIKMYKRDD